MCIFILNVALGIFVLLFGISYMVMILGGGGGCGGEGFVTT